MAPNSTGQPLPGKPECASAARTVAVNPHDPFNRGAPISHNDGSYPEDGRDGDNPMGRSLPRRPAVLMLAYVAVFAYAGPWLAVDSTSRRNIAEVVVAAALAILAARGSRAARLLMIAYTATGCFVMLFGSSQGWVPIFPRVLYMACYVFQIALLISTPMYERSRPGPVVRRSPAPWLPVPRVWALLASAGGGLAVTLLHLGNLRPIPCPAHVTVLAHTPCLAAGTGEPFAYSWFGGYTQNTADGMTRWLHIATPSGLQVTPFAADWAMWGFAILLVFYLIGLNQTHEFSDPLQRSVGGPTPAGP